MKNDDQFHKLVEDMLAYMALAVTSRDVADPIKASYFDRAAPWTKAFIELTYPEKPGQGRPQLGAPSEPPFVSPTTARVAIDYAYIGGTCDDTVDNPNYAYSLCRLRQVTAKQARGRLARPCSLNFILARACVRKDGLIDRAVLNYAGFSQGAWFTEITESMAREHGLNQMIKYDVEKHAKLCTLLQVAAESSWRVSIGWEGMPRVMFGTDPVGVREVFRLRDLPNGKTRRAALRHWVTQHWRESGEGSRDEVRRHLRGATEFTWNGLRCRVEPSLADREENQEVVQIVSPDQLEALLG